MIHPIPRCFGLASLPGRGGVLFHCCFRFSFTFPFFCFFPVDPSIVSPLLRVRKKPGQQWAGTEHTQLRGVVPRSLGKVFPLLLGALRWPSLAVLPLVTTNLVVSV